MIDFLSWDSQFFSLKIGKVELSKIEKHQVNSIISEKSSGGYDLVYLFASTVEPEADATIRKAGGLLTDQKVTYIKEFYDLKAHELPQKISAYNGPLTSELLQLAFQSGHASRFKKDPRLQPKFELLYTTWIEKSLSGEMADVVLVYQIESRIKAFGTLKKNADYGQFRLLAVSPELRGKGIGKAFMLAVENWFASQNIKTVRIITQKDNIVACKLYEKTGYSIEKSEIIYHL